MLLIRLGSGSSMLGGGVNTPIGGVGGGKFKT